MPDPDVMKYIASQEMWGEAINAYNFIASKEALKILVGSVGVITGLYLIGSSTLNFMTNEIEDSDTAYRNKRLENLR